MAATALDITVVVASFLLSAASGLRFIGSASSLLVIPLILAGILALAAGLARHVRCGVGTDHDEVWFLAPHRPTERSWMMTFAAVQILFWYYLIGPAPVTTLAALGMVKGSMVAGAAITLLSERPNEGELTTLLERAGDGYGWTRRTG